MEETYVQHVTFKTKVKLLWNDQIFRCMCVSLNTYRVHTQMPTCMNGVHSNRTKFSAAASRLFTVLG